MVPGREVAQDLALGLVLDAGDAVVDGALQSDQEFVACWQDRMVDQDRPQVFGGTGQNKLIEQFVTDGAGGVCKSGQHLLRPCARHPVQTGARVGRRQRSEDRFDLWAHSAAGWSKEPTEHFRPCARRAVLGTVQIFDGAAAEAGTM